jgi:hypothetical protein
MDGRGIILDIGHYAHNRVGQQIGGAKAGIHGELRRQRQVVHIWGIKKSQK